MKKKMLVACFLFLGINLTPLAEATECRSDDGLSKVYYNYHAKTAEIYKLHGDGRPIYYGSESCQHRPQWNIKMECTFGSGRMLQIYDDGTAIYSGNQTQTHFTCL